jgi:Ca-activated chloride channel homolog
MKIRRFFLAFALGTVGGATLADGLIIIHNPPKFAPHVRHYPFAPLEVVFHKVDVAIDGQKATTRVEQEFYNPNDAVLEGEYVFPIPRGAHIDKFAMRIGDREMEAELLDATKARALYEEIVRKQRDPALLEYAGRQAFRVRIFPIESRGRKKVSLSYTELLRADSGLISYVYPLNTEKFSAQPLKNVSVRVALDQGSSLKALYSPTHQVDVRRDGERRATVAYEASNTRPDRDFQLLFSTAQAELGVHLLTQKIDADDGWFLLLASPGSEMVKTRETNPKDVVFVLDTSGSMAGRKLEQAKKALSFCLESLNDSDRFEVLRFATEAESFFDRMVDATRSNRDRALDFVKGLRTIGGTAIADALTRALRLKTAESSRPFVVIFLTDGQPTVGETNEDAIVALATRRGSDLTRIFCFGIGADVNTHLLDKITERTRAASTYVLPEEDLELKVSSFFAKIKEPILTNVALQFPDSVRVSKIYPSPLPDLFRGDQLVITGRYSGSGEGELVLEGMLNGAPKRIAHRVSFSAAESHNDFIPQLWAMRRVGWLLDEIRLRGENRELRDEVVDLARRFAIVTPYTSYLIVEDEARRGVPLTLRSLQNLDKNVAAQKQLAESWKELGRKKDGLVGSYNARANSALKYAEAPAAAADLGRLENRKAVIANDSVSGSASERDLDSIEQQTRVVNGRSFFQNGAQWIDSETQSRKGGKTVRVEFASREYFDFLATNSAAAPWLALGRNVQFSLGDTSYEIFE